MTFGKILTITSMLLYSCFTAGAQQFHSLKVMKEGDFMSPPVIRLGSDERISINFDEWNEDHADLQYRLVHCGPDWKPSRLLDSEYLDSFNIGDIEDWAYSTNTFVHYVNYQLFIPNEQINPKVSGNYIVEIFNRDVPDEILAKARFSVAEQVANVSGSVLTQTDRGVNTEWQQLELEVTPTDVRIENPFSDVTVMLTQNSDPDSRRVLDSPSRVDGKLLFYNHQPQLIFKAGNEFRRFESIRTNYNDMHVDSMRFLTNNYHVWLTPDQIRAESEYSYDQTQQGRFLIREYNATDSNLGADYLTVHFSLNSPEVIDADVYVTGEFTGYQYGDNNRMHYDYNRQAYILEMPLKQGSYNYRYVAIPRKGNRIPDSSLIEGDKYETRNEYRIQVWYHPIGARYTRLISDRTLR